MATHRIPILGIFTKPDNSGSVYMEPAAINFGANDRYHHMVAVFADTATKISLGGAFRVPANYVGTPKVVIDYATTVNAGDVVWDFDAKAIADAESLDPNADDDAVTATSTVPGTARLRKTVTIDLVGTYVAGDIVLFNLSRDGAAADTAAASVYLFGAFFQYSDT